MIQTAFRGFYLSEIHAVGAEVLMEQDLHLSIPGDGGIVIYSARAVIEEINRHTGSCSSHFDDDTNVELELGELLSALKALPPDTNIFI
jgi:hypothetical protein